MTDTQPNHAPEVLKSSEDSGGILLEIDPTRVENHPISLEVRLSEDQESTMAAVFDNPSQNFFITGSAGTGKSLLLTKLQEILKCPITASTGIAAVGVSGVTLHSYLGIGLANGTVSECTRDAKKYARRRYIVNDLIVDEVSMLSAELLTRSIW